MFIIIVRTKFYDLEIQTKVFFNMLSVDWMKILC